jgi:hypothetical protein
VAIDYIWDKFKQVWISEEAQNAMLEIDAIQKGLKHKAFNPDSGAHQKFLKNLEVRIEYLKKQLPFLEF